MNGLLNYDMYESLFWLLPELALSALILLLTLMIVLGRSSSWLLKAVMVAGMVGIIALVIYQYILTEGMRFNSVFNTTYFDINQYSSFWKLILGISLLIVSLFPVQHSLRRVRGEYYILLLSVLLGGFILVMTSHFLTVVIALEIISLSSYMLAGISRTSGSIESGIKYFLFGAAATAVMIYGISWFYGITGGISLTGTSLSALNNPENGGWIAIFVIVLISSGILFKISVAPWHIWVPDVYEKTPTPVVAMFSVIPKLAGFAFLARWVEWLQWPVVVIAWLAVVTMSIGNFAALRQKNVKRMMGYSSIAHSGFLLMAFLNQGEFSSLMFYATIYAIMNMGTFLLLNYYERKYQLTEFLQFDGVFKIIPSFAIVMVIFMIGLTGLPPTAGFTAKLFLFSTIAQEYQQTGMPVLLGAFIFGILNTVISLAFYLKLPYRMIFKKMSSTTIIFKKYSSSENFLCIILVLAVLLLFFKPQWLMGWINNSSFAF
jgi:NADH-quinone oxidoreductase subunit N